MRTPHSIRPTRFSNAEIIRLAEDLTKEFAASIEPELALLFTSFDAIYRDIIYPRFEIELRENCSLGYDALGVKILGEYDPLDNVAYIDKCINERSRDPRRAFTLWHEVGGHGVLQGDWLRKEWARVSSTSRLVTTALSITDNAINVLERQANIFAANAGVPLWLLEHRIRHVFQPTRPFRYIGPSDYCLNVHGHCRHVHVDSFDDLCRLIAYYVKPSFGGMSRESVGYQVAKTYLVRDDSRANTMPRMRRTERKRDPQVLPSAPLVLQAFSGTYQPT